ncbi:hypothetical protein VP01_703g3 [Puccinia sorghi]|uniref:Phosphatidylglycerol/phosphatidylinositol transfer protein n=1 Tax=Puccinia sorghi TaxID=27349 RepID=A0A0L6UDP3_9BASI|nr:hypothetical protein VP01_703g3 [Puccinia sorghi]
MVLLLQLAASARSALNHAEVPFLVQSFAPVDTDGQPIIPSDLSNQVVAQDCPANGAYQVYGKVESMTITPCQRASPDQPCTFVRGRQVFLSLSPHFISSLQSEIQHSYLCSSLVYSNYTIQFTFETSLSSMQPRSSVLAMDKDGQYQYSGQSFNGCEYAACPVYAYQLSAYTYHFHTLASSFNYLTFNLTQGFDGPSMFCAGTPIVFQS